MESLSRTILLSIIGKFSLDQLKSMNLISLKDISFCHSYIKFMEIVSNKKWALLYASSKERSNLNEIKTAYEILSKGGTFSAIDENLIEIEVTSKDFIQKMWFAEISCSFIFI